MRRPTRHRALIAGLAALLAVLVAATTPGAAQDGPPAAQAADGTLDPAVASGEPLPLDTAPTAAATNALEGELPLLNNVFVDLESEGHTTCGVRPTGWVRCFTQWSADGINQAPPRFERYTDIDLSGSSRGCGIRLDQTLACWGTESQYQSPGATKPPAGKYKAIALGSFHGCAISLNDTVACWGSNTGGRSTPPTGKFATIDAGFAHSCGVRPNGAVVCWGDDAQGSTTPPSGTFVDVAVNSHTSCGIRTTGATVCWGINSGGREFAPPGIDIESIASSNADSFCGLQADGRPLCWGDTHTSLSSLAAQVGPLETLSVAADFACGLVSSGLWSCWGAKDGVGGNYWPPESTRWFSDVAGSNPFFADIAWMSDNSLSSGQGDGTYGSGASVTRKAMAAFLWRMAGAPEPPQGAGGFLDVPANDPFNDPIRWLASTGVTTGYGDGTFRPNQRVSRQEMAAFLWRMAGSPEPVGGFFADVPAGHPFRKPIRWMKAVGITLGDADGNYNPSELVRRGSMAAFVRRYVEQTGPAIPE